MSSVDILVEIGTEELPPKSLKSLSKAFTDGILQQLEQTGIGFESARSFASPRRLALLLKQADAQQPLQKIERRGPALKAAYDSEGKPTRALEGFARSCGAELDALETLETPKGAWVIFRKEEPGQTLQSLLPTVVEDSLNKLPIPKRMRWGAKKVEFVRPVHWVVMMADSAVIPATLLGHKTTNQSFGHRFHAPDALSIQNASDYENTLETHGCVIPDFKKRKDSIRKQVLALAEEKQAQAIIDEELLDEVTALNEYPHALLGSFEERFLEVPQEALISTMKENQKYFHLLNQEGRMLPFFITVSNINSQQPEQVIEGNERVIRPRLSDAAFFFETDKRVPLAERLDALKPVVFQKDLGSLFDRAQRISQLSSAIAEILGQEPKTAGRAGLLAKADLTTAMVLEFPEMQGIAGRYYAKQSGEGNAVATAIEEHYLPRFAGDELPESAAGISVALAEKLDTLTGIFGIKQPPTGTKDPFALRRAALAVLRLITEKELDLDLKQLVSLAKAQFACHLAGGEGLEEQVSHYIIERFRTWYDEQGVAAEVFLSVQATAISNPLQFDARVKAVQHFLTLEAAEPLIAANKRVANLIEKVKNSPSSCQATLLQDEAEQALYEVTSNAISAVEEKRLKRDYTGILEQLASLKEPLDRFFDEVMVMAEDEALRNNRIALLLEVRNLFLNVADISLLQGILNKSA